MKDEEQSRKDAADIAMARIYGSTVISPYVITPFKELVRPKRTIWMRIKNAWRELVS